MKIFEQCRDILTGERGVYDGEAADGQDRFLVNGRLKRVPRGRLVRVGVYALVRHNAARRMEK